MPKTQKRLKTAHGTILYPLFIPVTTYGPRYPLDSLIQPYLARLSKAVLVSYHYAQEMKTRPHLPLLIDSGGFAALLEGAQVIEEQGLGVLEVPSKEGPERLHPADVLDFQEQHADVAFTLDFPIPPKMDPQEAAKRQNLTIANAVWALHIAGGEIISLSSHRSRHGTNRAPATAPPNSLLIPSPASRSEV